MIFEVKVLQQHYILNYRQNIPYVKQRKAYIRFENSIQPPPPHLALSISDFYQYFKRSCILQ